ncbi:MAG: site-specific integrase [Polyangiaceae bacterium]|nr:site-specific integrase [Polyangiaceae bacterium]
MSTWHSVFWSPSKHRWLIRLGAEGRTQRQITVPQSVAPGPRSRKQAEQWATEQLGGKSDAPAVVAPKTLAELAPIVLELWQNDERLAQKTKADRESFLRLHILPAFGELAVEAIDVPKVRDWVRAMRKRGDARSSIGNRLSTLATLLSDLHAERHAPDNRVATAKAVLDELPASKKHAPVSLDLAAFSMLLFAASVPFWFRMLCALAGLAGLEAGVALGLRVKDVVLEHGQPIALRICQAVQQLGTKGYASIGPTKNEHRGSEERPRILPVHPALAVLLTEWLRIERERWCCHVAQPDDLLVPSASGKAWRPKVAKRLRRELAGLGIAVPDGLVFHRLRGCFATWLAAASVPKDQRQRLMGHAGDVEAEHYEVAGQLFESDFEAVARIAVEVRNGSGRHQLVHAGDRDARSPVDGIPAARSPPDRTPRSRGTPPSPTEDRTYTGTFYKRPKNAPAVRGLGVALDQNPVGAPPRTSELCHGRKGPSPSALRPHCAGCSCRATIPRHGKIC